MTGFDVADLNRTGESIAMVHHQSPREQVRLALPGGDCIVLTDMLAQSASADELNRNVYRLRADGSVAWQIQSDAGNGERQPYTNIYFDELGQLRAYCWNGGEYPVNLATGEIGQSVLLR